MKILFIHNIIAPYRTPLFEALSKKYEIQVVFLEKMDADRKWSQRPEELHFDHKFLKNKNYYLFSKKITKQRLFVVLIYFILLYSIQINIGFS